MKKAVAILSTEAKAAETLIKSMFMDQIDIIEEEVFLEANTEIIREHERVIVSGNLDLVKACMEACIAEAKPIAFLPLEGQHFLSRTFKIPKDPEAAIKLALEGEPQAVDTLRCNGDLVLNSVVVADVPVLSKSIYEKEMGLWERLRIFFREIRGITLHSFTLTTAKEQEIKTAASGVYIFEHDNQTVSKNILGEPLTAVDGKVFAVMVSPRSILAYLSFLARLTLSKTKAFARLPQSVGYVKSSDITIAGDRPYSVLVDREKTIETPVTLHVDQKVLTVVTGEGFTDENPADGSDKESIKVENIPMEKERLDMVERPLPFFSNASEERYKALFLSLREESHPSPQYLTLMVLSTLLATLGIFLNSASVVIGAMVLAPLMAPMVSFSMGVLRKDTQLFYHSLGTIAVGILLALGASALMTFLMPFQTWTDELSGRLHPSLLDLMVAVISGIAAAFARADSKISQSLAGVAIAVALVPPLSVVGIGLGWMNAYIVTNALLLFVTNLVGIVIAAALTFLVLGYSTGVKGKKSFWALGLMMALIAVPLYLSFGKMAAYADVQQRLSGTPLVLGSESVTLGNIELLGDEGVQRIRCDVLTSKNLEERDIMQLKKVIESRLKRTVSFEPRIIRVY